MKKYFVIAAVVLAAAGCTKTASQSNQNQNSSQNQNLGYYDNLANSCQGSSCCLASVNAMKSGNYQLANNGECPLGFIKDQEICLDSLVWCVPQELQTAGWNTYASPASLGFSIKYPSDLGFDTNIDHVRGLAYIPVCDDRMAACVYIARGKYPGTNFDGAGVSVNVYSDLNTETKCYNFKVATNAAQAQGADVIINGAAFKSATGGDAGLGHSEKVRVYRNFHNGQCFEIAAHVGQSAIGNYPEGTVKPFDSNAVWQILQGVMNTFKFTPAVQSGKMQVCPEAWIENDMPSIGPDNRTPAQKQYYVYKGQGLPLSDFDAEWVAKNCRLQLQHAY